MAPAGTDMGRPFTLSWTWPAESLALPRLGLVMLRHLSARQVRLRRDRRNPPGDAVGHQPAGGQRRSDAQPFMAGGEIEALVGGNRTDERELIRRGGAETGPRADRCQACEIG